MIVAHHAPLTYVLSNTFDKAFLRATSFFWIGVDLFFVLSGFLITRILLETRGSKNYLRSFYGRRIVRIFPLYYVFLSVLYFVLPALGVTLSPDLIHAQPWQWLYLPNIYIAFMKWPGQNIDHLWTLGIEEQFYLVWPMIVLLTKERYLKRGIIFLLLLLPFVRAFCIGIGMSNRFIYTFTLCHMDGLLLGALISIAQRSGLIESLTSGPRSKLIQCMDWMVAGLLFALVIVYYLFLRNDQFIFNFLTWPPILECIGITFISLPLAYIVMRAVSPQPNTLQRVMSQKYLRFAGKYSYALYMLHAPIVYWAGLNFPVPSFLHNLPPRMELPS